MKPDFPEKESPFANPYQSPTTTTKPDYQPHYDYQEPHRGTLVLVLGFSSMALLMFSFACCLAVSFISAPLGLGAWMMGRADLGKIAEGRMVARGQDQLQIGSVCGLISAILSLCVCLFQIGIVALLIIGIASSQ